MLKSSNSISKNEVAFVISQSVKCFYFHSKITEYVLLYTPQRVTVFFFPNLKCLKQLWPTPSFILWVLYITHLFIRMVIISCDL